MPPSWVHSLLCIICLGSEYSSIHKKKDEFWVKLGPEHRKLRHELYQAMRDLDKEGYSFPNILEIAIDKVREYCEGFKNWVMENKGHDEEKANFMANLYAQYLFHDIVDFIWDEKTEEERRILEASAQEIYLNPEEYSNLFPPWSWDDYFSTRKYENQREYVASLNYEEVPKQPIREVLSEQKSMKLWKKS